MKLFDLPRKVAEQIRLFYKESKKHTKHKAKKLNIIFKTKIKNTINWFASIDIDFIFVFLSSFILTNTYSLWARLAFSVGLTYVYKYLLVKKIIEVVMVNKRR